MRLWRDVLWQTWVQISVLLLTDHEIWGPHNAFMPHSLSGIFEIIIVPISFVIRISWEHGHLQRLQHNIDDNSTYKCYLSPMGRSKKTSIHLLYFQNSLLAVSALTPFKCSKTLTTEFLFTIIIVLPSEHRHQPWQYHANWCSLEETHSPWNKHVVVAIWRVKKPYLALQLKYP